MLASLLGGAPNEVSIVNFDSRPEAASPFTSDVAQWREAINHPDQGAAGRRSSMGFLMLSIC
jgi:hypothetical protein